MSSPLSALVGGVLLVWWPEDEHPNHPGPKFRPAYVMEIDLVKRKVLMAYGTSQRTNLQAVGEVIITQEEMPVLKRDTKFCMKRAKWIPLSSEFLSKSQTGADVLYLGPPPKGRADDFLNALMEAGQLNI